MLDADEEGDVGSSMKVILEAYLAKLPNCVNRELIDKVCGSVVSCDW